MEHEEKWIKTDRPLHEYPLGTKARSTGGGHWVRQQLDWKWHKGASFFRLGGDWDGTVCLPPAKEDKTKELAAVVEDADWSVSEIVAELEHIDAFEAANYFADRFGTPYLPPAAEGEADTTPADPHKWFVEKYDVRPERMRLTEHTGNDVVKFIRAYLVDLK